MSDVVEIRAALETCRLLPNNIIGFSVEPALAALDRIEAGGAEGWQLVPVEPTEEMLEALEGTILSDLGPDTEKAYAAMLSAAPPPPASQPEKEEK